jgi:predicted nucleotidyltransferase component of viral defense system
MYTNILPHNAHELLPKLTTVQRISNFYLSGGTALALQLGHRESIDLDFFTQKDFDPQTLQQELENINSLQNTRLDKGTLNTYMNDVKLQFLHYPYHLIEKPQIWEGIQISSVIDIACTKLITISDRGSKKDFIDLYVILKTYSLPNLFTKLEEKYPNTNYNEPHILKSLVFFADADHQPMPKMHTEIEWGEVKSTIIQEVKKITF